MDGLAALESSELFSVPGTVFAATMSYVAVNLSALAVNANYFSTLPATNITAPALSLLSYTDGFPGVLGENATGRLVAEASWQAFHEAGIYNRKDNSIYISSNYRTLEDNINVTVFSLDDYSYRSTQFPGLAEANGGTTWYPPGSDTLEQLWCDQGDLESYSQLVSVNPDTNTSTVVLTSFMGRNFSSLNDVRQHAGTGDLWFTDPWYGRFQFFRPMPVMPPQTYRFEPRTGVIQVVADGIQQPNGFEFSPDMKTAYITDTGGDTFSANLTGPATIYAYDVVDGKRLQNRRVFAYVDTGPPDGIHTDVDGNVFVGCGDGIHVWDPQGILLGKIFLGERPFNFAFAPGKIFAFANERLWVVENVKAVGREVCKDFGVGC